MYRYEVTISSFDRLPEIQRSREPEGGVWVPLRVAAAYIVGYDSYHMPYRLTVYLDSLDSLYSVSSLYYVYIYIVGYVLNSYF